MKSFNRIFIILALIFTSGVIAAVALTRMPENNGSDAVDLNRAVHIIKDNRTELLSLTEEDLGTKFVLFGENGRRLSSEPAGYLIDVDSPAKAAAEDYVCLPVEENGDYICTLVVPRPGMGRINDARKKIVTAGLMLLGLILLCAAIFMPRRHKDRGAGARRCAHGRRRHAPGGKDRFRVF